MSGRPDPWVIKVGGSVDEELGALSRILEALAELAIKTPVALVPGGGAFADFVRTRCAERFTRDGAAHIQAVLSMAQYGYDIVDRLPDAQPVHGIREVEGAFQSGRIPVFIPYPWILGAGDIPANWSVTSDTIAARFCGIIGAKKLVLLKSVEGIMVDGRIVHEIGGGLYPVTDTVDSCFFANLKPGWETWIINGRKSVRLKELVEKGCAEGTRIFS